MIPMRMAYKKMYGNLLRFKLADKLIAEIPDACAGIKNQYFVSSTQFHA
jgi:hypothetical protein